MLDAHMAEQSENQPGLETAIDICRKLKLIWPDRTAFLLMQGVYGKTQAEEPNDGFDVRIVGATEIKLSNKDYNAILDFCLKRGESYFNKITPASAFTGPSSLLAALPLSLKPNPALDQINRDGGAKSEQAHTGVVFCILADKDSLRQLTENEIDLINFFAGIIQLSGAIDIYKQKLKIFRHDLRTPLTSVSMISGLLKQEPDTTDLHDFGIMLQSATDKIDALINDFKEAIEE